MLMRETYLRKGQGLSDSGTYIIDINVAEPISAIILYLSATNGATSNQGVRIHDDIDKIELVDGSDTLVSVSGIELQALDFYHFGKDVYRYVDESGAAVQHEAFIIPFGRFIGDPEYYFDPKRFTNPQLKITTSLTIDAAAGFATGTLSLSAIAKVFSEVPPAAKGFFMLKNLYSFTTVASGDETVNMPRDYPYRAIMVRAFESGTAFETDLTNLKLSCDNDAFIPFDLSSGDLVRHNVDWRGKINLELKSFRTDSDVISLWLPYIDVALATSLVDFDVATIEAASVNNITLQLIELTTSPSVAKATADSAQLIKAVGYAPFFTVCYPFGDLIGQPDYFPSTKYGNIDLKLTQGGAGAAASVVLQQVRT